MKIVELCCLLLNIIAFIVCIIDKYLSKYKKKHISEKLILTISALGGAVGYYIAMRLFKHQEGSKKYLLTFYTILIVWFVVYIVFILL